MKNFIIAIKIFPSILRRQNAWQLNYSRIKTSDHLPIHNGDKLCHCKVGNKMFSRMRRLKRHFHIHMGEKPYSWQFDEVCNEQFSPMRNLNKHLLIHPRGRSHIIVKNAINCFQKDIYTLQNVCMWLSVTKMLEKCQILFFPCGGWSAILSGQSDDCKHNLNQGKNSGWLRQSRGYPCGISGDSLRNRLIEMIHACGSLILRGTMLPFCRVIHLGSEHSALPWTNLRC